MIFLPHTFFFLLLNFFSMLLLFLHIFAFITSSFLSFLFFFSLHHFLHFHNIIIHITHFYLLITILIFFFFFFSFSAIFLFLLPFYFFFIFLFFFWLFLLDAHCRRCCRLFIVILPMFFIHIPWLSYYYRLKVAYNFSLEKKRNVVFLFFCCW